MTRTTNEKVITMMRNEYGEGWANSGAWSLLLACGLLLLIAIVTVCVAVLWRAPTPPTGPPPPTGSPPPQGPDALRLLEQRYAAGDINDDDFRQRRRTLLEGQHI